MAARAIRVGLMVLSLAAIGALGLVAFRQSGASTGLTDVPTVVVRKADLSGMVRAPGEVDSSEKTTIECQIERLRYRNAGVSISADGSSEIIELIPDGTTVKEGDVLCRLNSADYEELVRQQAIEVEEDRANYQNALLDLEAAEIALREYRDGLLEQLKQQYQGQISLSRADVERQKDRVIWCERMVEIGYMPLSRLSSEQQIMQQAELTLRSNVLAYENLIKYTAPKEIVALESQIHTRRAQANYRKERLEREEKQLAYYQEQVEHCTIRAPHDGFVIYADATNENNFIELGAMVRSRQTLFYLPDLSQMEIETTLHETVVQRVRAGMPAIVRIESLPGVQLEGEVISVSNLPQPMTSWRQADDVKNYSGFVKLHTIPEGLLPGMTAQVEIMTSYNPEALVIPPQALDVVEGRNVCYVALEDHVERREVTIGEYHPSMIEIVDGLAEGDAIVLDPSLLDPTVVKITDRFRSSPENEEPFPTLTDVGIPSQSGVAVTTERASSSRARLQ